MSMLVPGNRESTKWMQEYSNFNLLAIQESLIEHVNKMGKDALGGRSLKDKAPSFSGFCASSQVSDSIPSFTNNTSSITSMVTKLE